MLRFALLLCGALAAGMLSAVPRPVKCIVSGFEIGRVSAEELLANVEALDKLPFDGVTVYVSRDLPDGTRLTRDRIMSDTNWTRENVAPLIPVLSKFRNHRSLRESLLTFRGTTTNHLDWTDDAAWARAGDNLAVLAWLAKESGLKGLVADLEDYYKLSQFVLRKGGKDPPYAVSKALARQRGREVYGKVFAVYPEITILFYQFLTAQFRYQPHRDPEEKAREFKDLLPSFCNGVLDALPPTAKIVDGCENTGYRCEAAKGDFYKQAAFQTGAALGLISPENHGKYRSQLSVSFGLYIDGYAMTDTKSRWYRAPIDGSKLKPFADDFAQACETVDEYVWLWCQSGKWTDWPNNDYKYFKKWRYWEDQLPGVTKTILYTLHPERRILDERKRLTDEGKYSNLATGRQKTGTFTGVRTRRDFSVKGVKPGERYGVIYSRTGNGEQPQVVWRKGGKWDWSLKRHVPELSLPDEDGRRWRTAEVTVPEGADELVLQINIVQGPDETLALSDVEIFKLERK